MDPNTYSIGSPTSPSAGESAGPSAGLAGLAAELAGLATQDLDGLADAVRAERVLRLRRLLDRLEGHWLQELAAVDARGAAGAEAGVQAPPPPAGCATGCAWAPGRPAPRNTARAVFRGPLTATATALIDGALSPAHASVLAHGTQDLPAPTAAEAEPVLVAAARRLDPPRLRRGLAHLQLAADPTPSRPPPTATTSGGACG